MIWMSATFQADQSKLDPISNKSPKEQLKWEIN
jgi:hypothetical protein